MYGLTSERKRPLSVIFMSMLGFRHVPDNYVQIIERHGRYHRAVEGPFVRRNLLSESFGPQMRVGIRLVEQLYDNIISRDGIAHNIRVSVKIFFDLRQAEPYFAKILVQNGEGLINGRASSLIDLTLRREVARLASTELLAPEFPIELEKAIEKRLSNLANMGISLLPIEDGIVVKEILAPERMQENRAEATNIEETINSLASQRYPQQVKQALLAHLLRDLGKQRPMFKALHLPEDLNATSEEGRDTTLPALRQPSGRLYDN